MIPPIFSGQTVHVVAGGPSLIGFDFEQLRGRAVIAINRAHEVLPEADVLWWSDAQFWLRNRDALLAHPAAWKATLHLEWSQPDQEAFEAVGGHVYQVTGVDGFDPRPGTIRHGNNSAFAAMHLAAHLGARRIVLWGVDMRHGPNGETHYHGGHGLLHLEMTLDRFMLPFFDSLAGPLADLGVEVLNANPRSALEVWPRVSPEEGLAA